MARISHKFEVKTFILQMVLMFMFTKVNLNVDESGEIKADPLVKRVTGLPGEQLVMQDGVLYSRTTDTDIAGIYRFHPLKRSATSGPCFRRFFRHSSLQQSFNLYASG